ncbi:MULTISPECIES: hypothetical protein [Cetobacterium]|jgi:hypothetical protein|uniref:Outer membrane lipoprotein carrier protein LolA n=1 Tax=Candidatus Cetobacterium colombiensis TaxID=3073100 RepID=A0ABU4W9Q0_9FUSO|nr:hypothetical protein [Candidatus Cetobacterium colombiensis]MDX8336253.1 hypothetical protein [Candidatus Cetobacterium colombiensis]
MIKIIFAFLLIGTSLIASPNRISNINNIYSIVKETLYLNGEKKTKEYKIEYVSPDYLRKETLSPNINKGEIFQYENGKSLVYIPLFDEISENNSEDVGNFLSIIKDLKNKDQNDKSFIENYYLQKVKELKYKDIYRIKIKEYKKIDGYLFPIKMEIFEKETKVADLDLKDTKINSGLKRKELKK